MSKSNLIDMKVGDVFAGLAVPSYERHCHNGNSLHHREILDFDNFNDDAGKVTYKFLDGARKGQKSTIKISSFASWVSRKLTNEEIEAKFGVKFTHENLCSKSDLNPVKFQADVKNKSFYPDIITWQQVKLGDVVRTKDATYLVIENLANVMNPIEYHAVNLVNFTTSRFLTGPLLRVSATIEIKN